VKNFGKRRGLNGTLMVMIRGFCDGNKGQKERKRWNLMEIFLTRDETKKKLKGFSSH